jgi:hypothetical protein
LVSELSGLWRDHSEDVYDIQNGFEFVLSRAQEEEEENETSYGLITALRTVQLTSRVSFAQNIHTFVFIIDFTEWAHEPLRWCFYF